ncbi:MAG: radical SAM/SPASM domain-containing protein, partial [Bacilli bacterium]|nr:radical SAM/SPASM domain-containing protein [Bacilli bacterium]
MDEYFAIQWHITDYCDQRCKHCYIFSEGHPELITMSLEDMIFVADEIIGFCNQLNRKPYIYLTGGDPILHPNFWDLLECFHKKGIRF